MKMLQIFILLFTLANSVLGDASTAEEQVYIDDLTPLELEEQIDKIQNEIYRIFNKSVVNNQLKIICRNDSKTGSLIKSEVCEPRFLVNASTRNNRSARSGGPPPLNSHQLQETLSAEFLELNQAMQELSNESEYFAELSTILGMLSARLTELKEAGGQ
jgi:isocitrate lyase